jgi:hypothetical protein
VELRGMLIGVCWGNLKEKKPLGIQKHRLEDNIKMDLKETR